MVPGSWVAVLCHWSGHGAVVNVRFLLSVVQPCVECPFLGGTSSVVLLTRIYDISILSLSLSPSVVCCEEA